MAKLDVINQNGKKVSDIELNDAVFGIEPNQQAIFDAVVMQRASLRQGTHDTKTQLLPVSATVSPPPQKKPVKASTT